MATLNLAAARRLLAALILLTATGVQVTPVFAQAEGSLTNSYVARTERIYAEALERWQKNSNDVTTSWELGRSCFDRADHATNKAQRAALAERGIAVCRHAIQLDPKSAPGQYYLGLNIGQLARTKLLTALYLINQFEDAMLASIAVDAGYDFAGAHRALGVLYRDAPGWPVSIGSRAKSRRHLEKAVELFPDYPGNQIHLLESWLVWGEMSQVRKRIPAVEVILKSARTNLTAEAWAASWAEWDRSWQTIKARAQEEPPKSSPAPP